MINYPGRWIIILSALCGFSALLFAHQFYVSMCKVAFLPEQHQLDISIRIFTSDLEAAVKNRSGRDMHLNSSTELSASDSLIDAYLRAHFLLKINDHETALLFLEKKIDGDATECHLRVENVDLVKKINIRNDILTELFDAQTNVVRVQVNGVKKFYNLTKQIPSETIDF